MYRLAGWGGADEAVPQEESKAGSTGEGVSSAGANVLPVHLRLTTVALRTEQRATDQAQSRSSGLVAT